VKPVLRHRSERGQSTVETAMVFLGLVLPLTFAIIFSAQLLWVWHGVAEWTRDGARYAATHCWQSGAGNVRSYMQTNVPPIPDRQLFQSGGAELRIRYYRRNAESNELEDFSCNSDCSPDCIPDSVRINVSNYEYRTFLTYWGLPPLQLPNLETSVPMESAGCSPDSSTCTP
jgi:hypothetical protein